MQDTDYLNPFAGYAVKDEIGPDNEIAEAGSNIVARRPHRRIFRDAGAGLVDVIETTVRGVVVIPRNILPDVDEILAGASGATV